MMKLMRRMAAVGVSAAALAGVVTATGGSAAAATAHKTQHPDALVATAGTGVTTAGTGHCNESLRTTHHRVDPWIADQLAAFEPAAARRLAVYDPWVKDQLAHFAPSNPSC
ncbi:hypothetical protein [Streptomyces sp. NPDC007905]|uniref:hypothetical protein n=1 Tax=Streptomyces sp. NPDC007905 TaxID=3364788 RepID=UPI0036E9FF95